MDILFNAPKCVTPTPCLLAVNGVTGVVLNATVPQLLCFPEVCLHFEDPGGGQVYFLFKTTTQGDVTLKGIDEYGKPSILELGETLVR